MPTDLPVRAKVQSRSNDWASDGPAVQTFYAVVGLLAVLLLAIATRFGMFDSLTVAESFLKAITIESTIDEINPFWTSSPPQQRQRVQLGSAAVAA
jgi:hypothetical protein